MARSYPLLLLLLLPACESSLAARAVAPPLSGPRYDLELQPDFDFFTFHGRARIRFANPSAQPLAEVPLHLYPNARALTPDDTRNVVVRKVSSSGTPATFDAKGIVLTVHLPTPVAPRAQVDLDVAFDGILPRMKPGESDVLGQSMQQMGEIFGGLVGSEGQKTAGDYGIFAYGDGILSFGNWYPQLPAWRNGSWQVANESAIGDMGFAESADYGIVVTAPADVVVVATGAQASERKLADGLVERRFEAAHARNAAVEMSRKFASASTKVGAVTVRSYYLPADEAYGKKALDAAAKALAFYDKSFGSYPWPELAVVEAPLKGGAGGVEFTGLVTCSSGLYRDFMKELRPLLGLLSQAGLGGDSGLPDIGKGMDEMLEFVVAHEVAHQWWNAAVGSDPRTSPFLDEALANFSAVRYFEAAHGAEAAARQREMQLALGYQFHRAFGGADAAVSQPAQNFESQVAYAGIVYGKGALFFEELVKRYGTERVFKALNAYVARGRFGVMDAKDLQSALQEALPEHRAEVAQLWQRWLHEKHGDEDIGTGALGQMLADNPLAKLLGKGANGGSDASGLEDLLGGAIDLLKQLQEPGAAASPDEDPDPSTP